MPAPTNLVTLNAANIIGLLYETESSDNPSNLTQFSTPSTGANSTYAFGPLQVDVGGNKQSAGQFLLNNGFTQTQVTELESTTSVSSSELSTLNTELQAIPTATMAQFQESMVGGYITQLNNVLQTIAGVNEVAPIFHELSATLIRHSVPLHGVTDLSVIECLANGE
jgi:hypothetical protein